MSKNLQFAFAMMAVGAALLYLLQRNCSRTSSFVPDSGDRTSSQQDIPEQRTPTQTQRPSPNRRRAILGVAIEDIDRDNTQDKGNLLFRSGCRVLISKVFPGSPAEVAGVQKNDCILTFNGQKVSSTNHLQDLVKAAPLEKTIEAQVMRGGITRNFHVTLSPALIPSTPSVSAESTQDTQPEAEVVPHSCPQPLPWDGKVRGWDKFGSPLCRDAKTGFYMRVATNQNRDESIRKIKETWKIFVERYVTRSRAACPNAEEMVFFDREGNSGAGILFPRKPDRWDEISVDEDSWMLRDANNHVVLEEVCFFLASDDRQPLDW